MSPNFTMNRHGQKGRIVLVVAATAVLALLFACGCEGERVGRVALATAGSQSRPFEEFVDDPVTLATVKTVVVFPFANPAAATGFDADLFAQKIANQLANAGQFRVIYPNEALRLVEAQNADIRRHNSEYRNRQLLGRKLADQRRSQRLRAEGELRDNVAADEDRRLAYLDPAANLEDAVRIGRLLKADAVLVGAVTDYDPYMRPRVSLWMQVAATGNTARQAEEIAQLCQWGVPQTSRTARGVVWYRQQNFDARDGNIGAAAYAHALRHHTQHSPLDTESYVRSPSQYLDYVGAVLAGSLVKARQDAVTEAETRALAEAKRQRQSQEQARGRLRDLVFGRPETPDPDQVMAKNHLRKTENDWRPDLYNREHPRKAAAVYAPEHLAPVGADSR